MSSCVRKRLSIALSLALPMAASSVNAQIDAGQVLRELTPEMVQPLPSRPLNLEAPGLETPQPGGPSARIDRVTFSGNQIFSAQTLTSVVADYLEEQQDLAGLRAMANEVSRYYREHGYLFARAVLPPQSIENGVVELQVIEGRYGAVSTHGHPDLYAGAEKFLNALLPGDVIESARLERSTLILSDQPGIEAVPVIMPGEEAGTGDLSVEIRRAERIRGSVATDNHGNLYTGQTRLRAELAASSNFLLGDQFSLMGLYTGEDLLFGSLRYELPVGGNGLRAFGGISYTDYELGKDFAALGLTGRAQVYQAGASYALIRSQGMNVNLRASYDYKDLEDRQLNISRNTKSIKSLPLMFQFDVRDSWGGAGVTYGALTLTFGDLSLNDELGQVDEAGTEGGYEKLAYDVTRIQRLPGNFSLKARLSGQYTSSNLDSYEGIGLGGPNAVRAFPVGEANGDRGWVGQVELRYQYGSALPYVFYDAGRIDVNADPYDNQPNHRDIAGGGLGIQYAWRQWSGDLAVAWRTDGGRPQASNDYDSPTVWASFSYRF